MIKKYDIVFGVGLVGIGKIYLVVVMVVDVWKKGNVSKIILIRFVVEVGESLGFLFGDLKEKVDFYLCFVYDVLYDIFGIEYIIRLMDWGVIEIVFLVYMCGCIFDYVFVILDEV